MPIFGSAMLDLVFKMWSKSVEKLRARFLKAFLPFLSKTAQVGPKNQYFAGLPVVVGISRAGFWIRNGRFGLKMLKNCVQGFGKPFNYFCPKRAQNGGFQEKTENFGKKRKISGKYGKFREKTENFWKKTKQKTAP